MIGVSLICRNDPSYAIKIRMNGANGKRLRAPIANIVVYLDEKFTALAGGCRGCRVYCI